jgi:hypothetical protein
MAKRRGRRKKTTRRKYKSAINLTNVATGAVTLTAFTKAMFGTTPMEFLLGGYVSGYSGSGGSSSYITLKEILAGGNFIGASGNIVPNLTESVGNNLRDNGIALVGTLVGVKVFRKLLSASGASRIANRSVRQIGLGNLVKF